LQTQLALVESPTSKQQTLMRKHEFSERKMNNRTCIYLGLEYFRIHWQIHFHKRRRNLALITQLLC
jgi:hypothetical protein